MAAFFDPAPRFAGKFGPEPLVISDDEGRSVTLTPARSRWVHVVELDVAGRYQRTIRRQ